MRKLSLQLNEIYLRNLQIIKDQSHSKRTYRGPNSNRTLMKLYLTKEVLEQCLQTIDIFKEILQDPIQKRKLMRDVVKNIKLKLYDQEGIIYAKGDTSSQMYLVIKGEVSLCMSIAKGFQDLETTQQKQVQYDYKQIDVYKEGVGFGEAQFIHGNKRGLSARAKVDGTVIGSINADGFQEIIQLYRQRVYYKKMQMFTKSALLKHLQPHQLEFIVNNAKPYTFAISKQIVSKGQKPKALYLITSGQIQLSRQQITKNQQTRRKHSKYQQREGNNISLKKVVVGVLEEGEFLGDCELALNCEFSCDAICKSEKVKMYICDERIIMSQITPELLNKVNEYYENKNSYRQKKLVIYKNAKSRMQKQMVQNKDVMLNQNQIKIKRQINSRYVQKTPSLIGHLSPSQIKKIIDMKYARIKTEPARNKSEDEDNVFPFPPLQQQQSKKLTRNKRALSPLLKRLKQLQMKEGKQEKLIRQSTMQNSPNYKPEYLKLQFQNDWERLRSSTKPLIMLMKPFHKRLQSLHERLSRELSEAKNSKRSQNAQIKKIKDQKDLSLSQMKRLSQFLSKIQSQNKLSF